MGDDQEWSFPDPPPPGLDAQFDALAEARREAEDRDEVLQIELAISILLLSRNYDLSPADYRLIFDFDDDCARLCAVQTAVSALISSRRNRAAGTSAPEQASPSSRSGATRTRVSLRSSWAVLIKTVLGS
ncbi:MAG: hypothetical protein ACLQVF_07325 [Isosphaeraceae bacterium]